MLFSAFSKVLLLALTLSTDLFSMVGGEFSFFHSHNSTISQSHNLTLSQLNQHLSSRIRVLCDTPAAEDAVRKVCTFETNAPPAALAAYLAAHGQGLLTESDRELLLTTNLARIARNVKRRDYTGVSLFPKSVDPRYFLTDFVLDLQAQSKGAVASAPPVLTAQGTKHEALGTLLALARANPAIHLSGAPFHTFLATEATKREVNLLSAVSLVFVLVIGLWLFRSPRFILPTLLTLAAGFAAGTAALFLVFPAPHVLTFLFGTSLIGLGVDYCYHGREKGLPQALLTSLLAFAPLLFSDVSVLRQMAVFTMTGLTVIFLIVWFVFKGARSKEQGTSKADRSKFHTCYLLLATCSLIPGLFLVRFTTSPAAFYRPDPLMASGEAALARATGLTNMVFRIVDQREGQALQHITAPLMGTDAPYPLSEMVVSDGLLLVPAQGVRGGAPSFGRDSTCFAPRAELEKLFTRLTRETLRLLGFSLVLLLVALLLLFRRAAIRHLLVITCTLAATLGTLGYLGEPLTFFHLLAFFVLIGLGLDYSIFHNLSPFTFRLSPSSRTVFASFLTSLVGLGALAFTSFPVTHALGVTFAAGLTYAYVFSYLVNRR